MTTPLARIAQTRIIVELPDCEMAKAVAACEVLVQEGLDVWSVPARGGLDPVELCEMFSTRALIGVHGVRSPHDITWTIEKKADFVQTDVLLGRTSFDRIDDAEITHVAPAFTPNEIAYAHGRGADAVAVLPANVLDNAYPKALKLLVPDCFLIARGDMGAYATGAWLTNGVDAVSVGAQLVGDGFAAGNLGDFRTRARNFAKVRPTL